MSCGVFRMGRGRNFGHVGLQHKSGRKERAAPFVDVTVCKVYSSEPGCDLCLRYEIFIRSSYPCHQECGYSPPQSITRARIGNILWPAVFAAIAELPVQPRLILELEDKAGIPASMVFLQANGLGQ